MRFNSRQKFRGFEAVNDREKDTVRHHLGRQIGEEPCLPETRQAVRRSMYDGGVGKRLLNVRDAARYLGLQIDTVYKKARMRELPFVKVGRALRFDIRALDLLIEQNAIPIA